MVAAYTQTDDIGKTQTAAVGKIQMGADVQTQQAVNTWVEVDTCPARVRALPALPARSQYYPFLLLVVYVPDGNTADDTRAWLLYS